MRIVLMNFNNDVAFGLMCALESIENQCVMWDKRVKPAYDMFDELKPDLLLCGTGDVDETIVRALEEYKQTKVIFFGFGTPVGLNPALICYPPQLSDSQISIINPKHIPYVRLDVAANVARFCGGHNVEKYHSDILFISDNPNINEAVMSIFANLIQDFRAKILGPIHLGIPYYLGNAQLNVLCDNIKSTKCGLDFMNKHVYDYFINKVFCLSFDSEEFAPRLTPENFSDEIRRFMSSDKLRAKHTKIAFQTIREKHTYFHRLKDVFDTLGYEDLGKAALVKLDKVLKDD
jgi:hypothetical protein